MPFVIRLMIWQTIVPENRVTTVVYQIIRITINHKIVHSKQVAATPETEALLLCPLL